MQVENRVPVCIDKWGTVLRWLFVSKLQMSAFFLSIKGMGALEEFAYGLRGEAMNLQH